MEKNKSDRYYEWLESIFGTKRIGQDGADYIDKNYHYTYPLSFSKRSRKRFENLFKYVFTVPYPMEKAEDDDKRAFDPERKTYSKALSAIVKFFNLDRKYTTLYNENMKGKELKVLGKKLCACCIFVVNVFFDENEKKLDKKLKERYKEKVIQLLESEDVTITEDGEMAAEATKSQHDSQSVSGTEDTPLSETKELEFPDMTPAQLAKVSRQIRKAMPPPEPEDFLNQPQHSLPHRNPSMKYDEREYYTYEDFNEDIDHIIKVLSELPDDLDDVQKCSLYRMVDELCGYRKYFCYNLSLEKKQQTLSTLESTADRFFEDVIGQPLPPKSSVSPEKWQACFDKGRSSAALEMCITALRRYINNETNKKTD